MPSLNTDSLTIFQKKVFSLLMEIPFGTTVSYEEIKNRYEARYESRMSSQAIGQALKRNPFPILVPCHRIIKKNGQLGGYAFGKEKKKELLRFEGIKIDEKSNIVIK